MAKKTKSTKSEDPVVRELDAIKRLLILQLYQSGTKQGHVAKALDISASELSGLMPFRALKASSDDEGGVSNGKS